MATRKPPTLGQGKSQKGIGTILNISIQSMELHQYRIMGVTRGRTIADLNRYAEARGIVREL